MVRTGRAKNYPRGRPRSSKVDKQIKNFVTEVLQQEPLLTLAQLNEKLAGSFMKKKIQEL